MRGYKNFDGSPHPGNLRHRIEIGYTQSTVNENGYPDAEDIVLCRVWADATDAGNQHYRSADVMNTEAVINFTIRYRADVVPGMWVKFRGKKWIISTLGEYGFRRDYLGLKACPKRYLDSSFASAGADVASSSLPPTSFLNSRML